MGSKLAVHPQEVMELYPELLLARQFQEDAQTVRTQ